MESQNNIYPLLKAECFALSTPKTKICIQILMMEHVFLVDEFKTRLVNCWIRCVGSRAIVSVELYKTAPIYCKLTQLLSCFPLWLKNTHLYTAVYEPFVDSISSQHNCQHTVCIRYAYRCIFVCEQMYVNVTFCMDENVNSHNVSLVGESLSCSFL